ncbi:DEAD/DEAH box helicase domain containing protein [Theileria equi strain WA]|uniref:DEAD/DEAH box helicase domain containing protein n=1 Tax=Theileria equi strain WA TaxID=1537102 RepID=L1LDC5_THEEQ|nr:DEAD/DEAH box helicase domain containing protein [Theileria equi strain WA]EKX73259.1 DEAD/DEAH box helicase domain containing protein [Theileria equi strain WA]|eukprot:XP_004832711.1 DEAD/DEAH box helicase domain containing protein [Theileria equi strain WA]
MADDLNIYPSKGFTTSDDFSLDSNSGLKSAKGIDRLDSVRDKVDDVSTARAALDNIEAGSFGVTNPSTVNAIIENKEYSPKTRLTLWHALSPTDYMDLFTSVGVSNTSCLISAESLIVYVCCIAEKEGYSLLDLASSSQTLQFIYRVEKFLKSFSDFGATFNLVFFDVFEKIFSPSFVTSDESDDEKFFDGYLLLRSILLSHAKLNNIHHTQYNDWFTDKRWFTYLAENEPTCIFIEDGSSFFYIYNQIYELVNSPGKKGTKANSGNLNIYAEYLSLQSKIDRYSNAVQTLISLCLSHNLSVVYLFDIGKHSHDFQAFISFASSTNISPSLHEEVSGLFIKEYRLHDASSPSNAVVVELLKTLTEFSIENPGLRDLIACNYILQLKQMFSEIDTSTLDDELLLNVNSFLLTFKVFLLHNYLVDILPLKDRSTKPVDTSDWEFFQLNVAASLDFMSSITIPILNDVSKTDYSIKNCSRDICDLFDGNLFVTILYFIITYGKDNGDVVDGTFLSLPAHVTDSFNKFCSYLSLGGPSTFYPIDLSCFKNFGIYDILDRKDVAEPQGAHKVKLVKLNNPFINLFFNMKNLDESSVEWHAPKNDNLLFSFDKLGWRDPSSISERIESIDFHLHSDVKEKQADFHKSSFSQRRSLQHQTTFSFLLSKYLGSQNLHHPIITKLEHHWLDVKLQNLLSLSDNTTQASSQTTTAGSSSKAKLQKSKEKAKKVSAKAEQLRQKHNEAQESKKIESDTNVLSRLEARLPSLFSNENSFEKINENILDFTDGQNRQVDLIYDFKWVKSVISTKQVQLQFLFRMIECLHTAFNGYRLKIIRSKSERSGLRKMICLTSRLILVCFNEYKQLATSEHITLLQTFLMKLGMDNFAKNMFDQWVLVQKDDSQKAPEKDKKSKSRSSKANNDLSKFRVDKVERYDFAIPVGKEAEFQLAYMGDLMERTLGSTTDPRVLFKPDAWQRVLLDVVDARESALVVAPTSTGKTYICYYAMEQVLRLDDDGIVIYVSPNNALALQVTYEVTARFASKTYGTSSSCASVLSASFLEKFHDPKWNSAQILITVPSILEKLLIAMRSSERNFMKRIEYIIFDEIHCISDKEMGPFLERTLHLSPCPFLALSATVGNPLQFHQWLSQIEKTRRGFPDPVVHYISFDERFSDLKLELYNDKSFTPLNPASCLSYYNITTSGFPSDLFLPPKDCYIFISSIMAISKGYARDFEYLIPSNYFDGCTLITKRQYRYYLATLKHEVSLQIQKGAITEEDFSYIISTINSFNVSKEFDEDNIYKLYPLLHVEPASGLSPSPLSLLCNAQHDYLMANEFLQMLNNLEQKKRLPCLVFIFDRNHMNHVLMSTVQLLRRKQWEKYYGTPEAAAATKLQNKQRQDRYQMLMRQYEAERKMRGASREQKEELGLTGSVGETMEMPEEPVDVAEDYDPEFNFYNRKIYVNYTDEVEKFINIAAMSIANRRGADLFIEGLRRGIGIHHEGLPHKFTMLTETLLRLGFLNVIISSKSLAFGINVPCKSVVFAGDNYELTPLMFKQMSGRCGRRGFDLSGHVVFWCIPQKRIKQLLLAQLSNLTGSLSTTPTTVLSSLSAFNSLIIAANSRTAAPLNTSKASSADARVRMTEILSKSREAVIEPKIIAKRLSSIFLKPLQAQFSTGKDSLFDKIKYRISAEILVDLGLIDSQGLVKGCCELSIITREMHPSNLFLSSITQTGTLHKLLEGASDSPYTFLQNMAHIIHRKTEMGSVLLLRRILSPGIRVGSKLMPPLSSNIDVEDIPNTYDVAFPDSFPLLPESTSLKELVSEYNSMVLDIVTKYISLLKAVPLELPLTSVSFDLGSGTDENSWFHDNYKKRYNHSSYRAPFVAIGGKGNQSFGWAHELWLCSNSAEEITVDMIPTLESNSVTITQLDAKYNVIKSFDVKMDNSYICDYWTHGRFSCLRDSNGLGQYGWYYLKRLITFLHHFKYVTKTYTNSLLIADPVHEAILQSLARLEPMFNRI